MSGRTLVESRIGRYSSTKSTNTELKVPGLKVTGLRIDTDNASMWRKSLRVCLRFFFLLFTV